MAALLRGLSLALFAALVAEAAEAARTGNATTLSGTGLAAGRKAKAANPTPAAAKAAAASPPLSPPAQAPPPKTDGEAAAAGLVAPVQPRTLAQKALMAAANTYAMKDQESRHSIAHSREDKLAVAVAKSHEFSRNVHKQVEAEQAAVAQEMQRLLKKTQAAAASKEQQAREAAGGAASKGKVEEELSADQAELMTDEKEIKVQLRLAKEKEDAVHQADAQTTELRKKADELEKEAEVASKIAEEKRAGAQKEKAEEAEAEKKLKELQQDAAEEEKFLAMTKKQAQQVRDRDVQLKARKADLEKREQQEQQAARQEVEKAATAAALKTTQEAAAKETKTLPPPQPAAAPQVDMQTLRRLMEENAKLKQEKAELKAELDKKENLKSEQKRKTAAAEVQRLKKGLHNKLAAVDKKVSMTHHSLKLQATKK